MDSLRKIAFDARLLEKSGIGRYLKTLIRGVIESKRFHVTLLGAKSDLTSLKALAPHALIELRSPIYSIGEQLELKRKVPACDLFLSPHFNVPLLSIKAKKRLVTIHDLFHLAHYSSLTLPQRLYASLFYRKAVSLSDRVITVSKFSKEELGRYVKAASDKAEVIPNGLDGDLFYPVEDGAMRRAFLEKYQIKTPFALALGNVKPHKNLVRLLAAYESLDCAEELVIAGQRGGFITEERALFSFLEERPHLKERVRLIGVLPDSELKLLYSAARALFFPSLYEGFGFPPLEAMACGCPVLASNKASLPEILGAAALYVDPLDVASIRRAIDRILSDESLRKTLIEKGYERAKAFDKKRMIESHLSLIEEVINR